jgi:peroxiredoxin
MAEAFDPYHQWLGISAKHQPPNHYRLLGIDQFESNLEVIDCAADRQMAHLRSFQVGKYSALSQQILNEISAARLCLLTPAKKAAYDQSLREAMATQSPADEQETHVSADLGFDVSLGHPVAGSPQRAGKQHASWQIRAGIAAGVVLAAVTVAVLLSHGKTKPREQAQLNQPEPPAQTVAPPSQLAHEAPSKNETPAGAAAVAGSVASGPVIPPGKIEAPGSGASGTTPASTATVPVSEPPKPATSGRTIHALDASAATPALVQTDRVDPSAKVAAIASATITVTSPPTPGPTTTPVADAPKPEPAPTPNAPALPPPAPKKLSPPDEAALKKSLELAREIYKKEWSNPDTAGAKTLLNKAAEVGADPTAEFALLQMAREIAVAAGDGKTAFEAVQRTADRFEIDGLQIKAGILAEFAKGARTLPRRKAVAEEVLSVISDAIAQDNLSVAKQLDKLAAAEIAKVRDKDLVQRHRAVAKELAEALKAAAEVAAAQEALRAHADDEDAHLAVGKHLCFVKGDWQQGLPHLAKGNDSTLKSIAGTEQSAGGGGPAAATAPQAPVAAPGVCMQLGDAWWDISQNLTGKARQAVMLHAGHWYQQALARVDAPLVRAKIEGRLATMAKAGLPIDAMTPRADATAGTVTLQPRHGLDAILHTMSGRMLPFSDQPPTRLLAEPKYRGRVSYAAINLGDAADNLFTIVVENLDSATPRLFVDSNRDRKITESEALAWGSLAAMSSTFLSTSVMLDAPYSSGLIPTAVTFRSARTTRGMQIIFGVNTGREGEAVLDGKRYRIMLVDLTQCGRYELSSARLWFDLNQDGRFDTAYGSPESYRLSEPLNVNGKVWEAASVSADGLHVAFRPSAANVAARSYMEVGDLAYDFTAVDMTGKSVRLKDEATQAKYVLLYFWSTFAPNAVEQLERMRLLQDRYRAGGLRIIAVATDGPRAVEAARSVSGVIPVIIDGTSASQRISRIYRASMVPQSIVVDRNLKIVSKEAQADRIEGQVRALMGR